MATNPYVVSEARVKKRVRLVAVANNPIDIVSRSTGEVVTATPYVGRRAIRDVSEFVKVYDPVEIGRMSVSEFRVFMYALSKMDFDGHFDLVVDECMELMGMCRRNVMYGIEGLIEKDAVRRDRRSAYWINPNIAYRGSRDELIGDVRRVDMFRELNEYYEEGNNDSEE